MSRDCWFTRDKTASILTVNFPPAEIIDQTFVTKPFFLLCPLKQIDYYFLGFNQTLFKWEKKHFYATKALGTYLLSETIKFGNNSLGCQCISAIFHWQILIKIGSELLLRFYMLRTNYFTARWATKATNFYDETIPSALPFKTNNWLFSPKYYKSFFKTKKKQNANTQK